LKNHGYNLEHNFGHGENHSGGNFCLLNLIAFLFHALLFLGDENYRAARERAGRRDNFYSAMRSPRPPLDNIFRFCYSLTNIPL
jgi:hypothetical protein